MWNTLHVGEVYAVQCSHHRLIPFSEGVEPSNYYADHSIVQYYIIILVLKGLEPSNQMKPSNQITRGGWRRVERNWWRLEYSHIE